MKINIQSPGFTPKLQLINFVIKKINKLTGFYREIIGSEVCLRLDGSASGENKICSIRLLIPGNDLLVSTSRYRKFEESITQAIETLKRQIKKRKTKITGRRKDIIRFGKQNINNPV
jgi:putative sigma-54 modulation protein